MTYDNAEDYLVRAQEAANFFDNDGRKEGISQFIDEKSYKPGLATYDTRRADSHVGGPIAVDQRSSTMKSGVSASYWAALLGIQLSASMTAAGCASTGKATTPPCQRSAA